MHCLQRTVLISLGDEAAALASELFAAVDLPILAHVGLGGSLDEQMEGGDRAVALLAALQAVSNAAALEQLLAQGATLERTDAIAVWLVVDIAAAGRLPALIEARQQAMDLAWRHFRCTLPTHALVLSAPEAGDETNGVLKALESLPQPLESLLLAGQVNADGLGLAADEVRTRLREALRQLIVSPLRRLPARFWQAAEAPWSAVEEEGEAAGGRCDVGLTWQTPPLLTLGAQFYPNPAGRLWAAFVRRWVQAALAQLVAPTPAGANACELATEWLVWQPDRLQPLLEGVMGAEPQMAAAESYGWAGWAQWDELLAMVDEDEARVQRALGKATAAGVAQLAAWVQQWQRALDERLAADLTAIGAAPDLAMAEQALVGYRGQWLGWAQVMDEDLAAMAAAQAELIGRRNAARLRLEGLLGHFSLSGPVAGLAAGLRLLLRPRLWLRSLRAYGSLDASLRDYTDAIEAVLSSEMQRRRCDLLRQHYLVGAEQVGRMLAMVGTLAATLRQAQAMAAPAPVVEDAVLDEAMCDRLYGEVMGDGSTALKRFLAQKPLVWRTGEGEWRTYEEADLLLADLQAFAGRWLGPLLGWGADRFVAFALADDEERLTVWLKGFLAGAAPLWPTGLQAGSLSQEAGALVVADPEDSPLLSVVSRWAEQGDWQIVRARASDPLVVLRVCLLRQA
jgi:hypothetical protein